MVKRSTFLALIIFIFVTVLFFYKAVFQGQVPFPGDLLVGNYAPYNSYSFIGYAPGSFPHKAQNIDVVEQLYPWKFFSIEILKSFEFPLWNPYNFSGTPHIAAIQSGTFYPFNILFFILPFVLAWSIFIILQPILAGFFTYLFLRKLKLHVSSCLFGGIAFAFSSFLVVWMQYGNMVHALIWLPLILWLILHLFEKPSLLKSVILSMLLSFCVFAGHFQISLYVYVFSFIFALFVLIAFYKGFFFRRFLTIGSIYAFSLFLSAMQTLPSIEIFLASSRSEYVLEILVGFLIPQYHSISVLFPDFFGSPVTRNYWPTGTYIERAIYFGIIPFFFALYAVVRNRNRYVWFFMIAMLAVFLITFDTIITKFMYSLYIPPIIGTSVPTRLIFVFAFSGSVLAAFGFNRILEERRVRYFLISAGILTSIVFSIWFFVLVSPILFIEYSWFQDIKTSLRNMIIPTGVLAIALVASFIYIRLLRRHSRNSLIVFTVIIITFTAFELFIFFQKFTPFSPQEAVYPKNSMLSFIRENQDFYRSWGYGSANIPANIQTYEEIYSTDGYDPFYIKRYGELLSTTGDGKVSPDIMRANARLIGGFGEEDLKNNFYRQRLMNLLGVKYVYHKKSQDNHAFDKTFDENTYELVWHDQDLQIYENKDVLPRAFIVNDYILLRDGNKIIDALYDDTMDLSQTIILEKKPNIEAQNKRNDNMVTINKYSGNEIELVVDSESSGLLFLSDAYFPGWSAYVNDEKREIYRANYSFRAVEVPKGKSVVVFRYEPQMFVIGIWISGISFGLVSIIIIFAILRRKI